MDISRQQTALKMEDFNASCGGHDILGYTVKDDAVTSLGVRMSNMNSA